jgi:hypothetical protein
MHTQTPTEEARAFRTMKNKERALARLTHDWQPLLKIRLAEGAGNAGFADLVHEGAAVARFVRDEKPGFRIQYKLAGPAPALSPRAQRRKERKVAA